MNSTKELDPKQQRQFYLIVGTFLIAFAGWKYYRGKITPSYIYLASGIFLLGIEFAVKSVADFLFRIWMAFAQFFGNINTFIIITLVYFLFITPVSLIKRLFGKASPNGAKACRDRKSAYFALLPDPRGKEQYHAPY